MKGIGPSLRNRAALFAESSAGSSKPTDVDGSGTKIPPSKTGRCHHSSLQGAWPRYDGKWCVRWAHEMLAGAIVCRLESTVRQPMPRPLVRQMPTSKPLLPSASRRVPSARGAPAGTTVLLAYALRSPCSSSSCKCERDRIKETCHSNGRRGLGRPTQSGISDDSALFLACTCVPNFKLP